VEYFRLVLDLLAVIGGSSMVSLLSPWRMTARFVPALLFIVGMIVIVLPTLAVAALALMLPAAWIQKLLGIELVGHEPLNVGPAVEKARNAAQAAREKVLPSKPVEVTQFVDRPYPSPEDAAAVADDLNDEDQKPASPADPSLQDKLELAAKGLPAEFRQRLAGQRAGREGSAGLRNQTVSTVRSFVPSLLS
jgi:hypothetical protein